MEPPIAVLDDRKTLMEAKNEYWESPHVEIEVDEYVHRGIPRIMVTGYLRIGPDQRRCTGWSDRLPEDRAEVIASNAASSMDYWKLIYRGDPDE